MASQVYFESGGVGDWYDCIAVTAAGESPATAPDKWRKISIPQCLEQPIVDLALAFIERGEAQSDKSLAGKRMLEGDMDRLILQHADFGTLAQPIVFTR